VAITYVDSSAATANNPTSGSFSLPLTAVEGNFAICWWYTLTTAKTITITNSDLTQRELLSGGTGRLYIGYRFLNATDIGTGTIGAWTSSSQTNSTTVYGCAVFAGVDTVTPFDVADPTPLTNAGSTTIIDCPDISPASASTCVVCVGGKADDTTSNPPAGPTVGGSATTVDNAGGTLSWGSSTTGSDASAGLAYILNAGAAGAKTVTSFTWASGTSAASYGVTMALRNYVGKGIVADTRRIQRNPMLRR